VIIKYINILREVLLLQFSNSFHCSKVTGLCYLFTYFYIMEASSSSFFQLMYKKILEGQI